MLVFSPKLRTSLIENSVLIMTKHILGIQTYSAGPATFLIQLVTYHKQYSFFCLTFIHVHQVPTLFLKYPRNIRSLNEIQIHKTSGENNP